MPTQQIGNIAELVVQHIQLVRNGLNFSFGAPIHVVIQLAANPIFRVLAILAHHDHGSLIAASIDRNKFSRING